MQRRLSSVRSTTARRSLEASSSSRSTSAQRAMGKRSWCASLTSVLLRLPLHLACPVSRHIKTVHLKEKPAACLEQGCGKKFSNRQSLEDHLRTAHGSPKMMCPEQGCYKEFSERRNLEYHLRVTHGASKLVCKKDKCTATFVYQRDFYKHMEKTH